MLTAQKRQHCHPAIDGERVNIMVPVALANEIDDNISAVPAGDFFHFFREVLGFVISCVGCSVWDGEQPVQLFLRGCSRSHRESVYR